MNSNGERTTEVNFCRELGFDPTTARSTGQRLTAELPPPPNTVADYVNRKTMRIERREFERRIITVVKRRNLLEIVVEKILEIAVSGKPDVFDLR